MYVSSINDILGKCFSVVTDYATLFICWKNQIINWTIIGKFTALNHWCHLLNVRASFTVKGTDKADRVSRRPEIHPDDVHLRRPVEMFLSGWMEKYLICVIKAMRRHCWYFQRILSPLMMTSWPFENSSCSLFSNEWTHAGKIKDWKSHPTDCIPTMIGWLYPVRHKISVSCCLLNVLKMLIIKIATHVGNFVKTFLEGTCVYCWKVKLFPPIVMFAIAQTRFCKGSPFTKGRLPLLITIVDFMVFHKSLCLIDNPALLSNLAIFNEEIEFQTQYECG